jgi:hypothetical protein
MEVHFPHSIGATPIRAVVLALPLMGCMFMGQVQKPPRVGAGTWGGDHIRLVVREGGADVQYDCAHGEIAGPLELNKDHRFDVRGTFVRQGPGPIRIGRDPVPRPARYEGKVNGRKLTLTVTLTDTSQAVGTFTLTRGRDGRLWKCR